ncbi:hypothetical protein [Polymorphospora sp. NPDC050346]|uniref:hypothetical protein n=1 Tax=Polymorphospora sp. NPDC050346 TaxID=3155780 RepID=UPI0033C505B0
MSLVSIYKRPARVESAETLRAGLKEAREVIDVRREDARERRAQDVNHRVALAAVDERAAAAARARRERARDADETAALAELYRRAARSGARARVRADIERSAEMRALRVARVRQVTLLAGIPVLAAFAAWSTTGVQAGVVRLLGLEAGTAGWWAGWAMEPALITVVALIIIGRAVLRSAGGDTDWRADVAEWAALSLSLALNLAGGWHGNGFWTALGGGLAHSVGPIGAAGTAFLIGVFDSYAANARPWDNAPRLADLNLTIPAPVPVPPVHSEPAAPVTLPPPVPPPVVTPTPAPEPTPVPAPPAPVVKAVRPAKRQPSAADRVVAAIARSPKASDAQIAARLGLSEATVKRHRRHAVDSVSTDTPPADAA